MKNFVGTTLYHINVKGHSQYDAMACVTLRLVAFALTLVATQG